MTGFEDVNVGDKVRLTDSEGEEHVIRVCAVAPTVGDDWAITGNHGTYHSRNWSVEVLEHAPKPLPDAEQLLSWYKSVRDGGSSVEIGGVKLAQCDSYGVTSGESTARKAVVSEIVAYLRSEARYVEANGVQAKFGGTA